MSEAAPGKIVIVGGGQAALQAIDTLRRRGYKGKLTCIAAEPELPYQRPPLSKSYLEGALDAARLALRGAAYFSERSVEVRTGMRAVSIDRDAQRVRLADGDSLEYDALLLATGSQPRRLETPGHSLEGVHLLRTRADADRLRGELGPGKRIVIVGGGFIGLEVAATARKLGLSATVLEMADRVMGRIVCGEISAWFAALHARHGVTLALNAQVAGFEDDGAGRVRAVRCADGSVHPADVVLVGIGVIPGDALARDCGLACDNGIVVDEHCRTNDPRIFAAGDCTDHPSPHYARRLRLESVDNATEQGTSAALNMLGIPTVHDKVPWFWSDQYEAKLIIIGLGLDHDASVMRGNPESGSFSMCYLKAGELVAVDTINNARDQMAARKLIAAHARPDATRLSDASRPMAECL